MPSDRALRAMNSVHRAILAVTRGRLGWNAGGMPVLELTTTGRKTGQPRTAMLTSPVQIGDSFVVVASRGGDDTHPAWYLNLRADPRVEVVVGGAPATPMHARVASPEERAALWPEVTRRFRHYAGYQRRTDREIPLVFLEPVS